MPAGRGTSLVGPVHADGSKFGDFAAAVVNIPNNFPAALAAVTASPEEPEEPAAAEPEPAGDDAARIT